jgi:hypothetical protein
MTDNDFSAIKPVENLPSVAPLTAAGQRQERRRRQNPSRRGAPPDAAPPEEAAPEQASEQDRESHTIDYCA